MPNIWKNGAITTASNFVLPLADEVEVDDGFELEEFEEKLPEEVTQDSENDNGETLTETEDEIAPEKEKEQLIQEEKPQKKQRETPAATAARLRSEVQAVVNQVAKNTKSPNTIKKNSAAAEINFATVQANEIIANAHKSAAEFKEKLIEQANVQIQEEMEKAQKEGYKAGYDAGHKLGEMKAQKEMENKLVAEFKQIMQKETRMREELIDRTEHQLIDVTIAVAEKIMQISLKSSKEVITRMISVATEKLKRREWVRIHVAESDAAELVEGSPELRAALSGLSDNVKIVPMQEDEPGTCIIEMPDEIIDASVSSQLKTIKDLISQ